MPEMQSTAPENSFDMPGDKTRRSFLLAQLTRLAGPGYARTPPSQLDPPYHYRPCKADVAVNGRDECIN